MKLSQIKPNPSNPRIIRDDKFNKLVKSIQQFPAMMEKRPIVVDDTMTVLGGNMRLRAIQHIYGKSGDIPDNWVTVAQGWTEEQKREFIIKDNAAFGEWDWDALANEWNADDLTDWGIDVPQFGDDTEQTIDSGGEIDINAMSDTITLKFELSIDEHSHVMQRLQRIDANKEQALLKLCGYGE